MLINREAKADILEGAKYFPVVAILGPRQSGKTTIAQMTFKKHNYVSLEDLDMRAAATHDPRTFLIANRNEHGMIIDEFQYVPQLLSYIQTIVDEEKKNGFFILTGSQNFLMNQNITQSLAGRVSISTLLPLSVSELKKNEILPAEIEEMLYLGSYPAIYSKKISPSRLYKNYLHTYIERDVRALAHVGDLIRFQTFLTLCATRIGQLLNLSSLSSECGISDTTAKRWISILEASYIIFLLRPHHTSLGKRLIKSPKIYFYDTGLVCSLLKIKQSELDTHPNRSNLFESFIISEILKWYYNRGKMPTIYFWRDKTGHEIDCIIEEGKTMILVEIKASRTTSPRFFEGLKYWEELAEEKKQNSFVIYTGSQKQVRGYTNLISWQSIEKIFKTIE